MAHKEEVVEELAEKKTLKYDISPLSGEKLNSSLRVFVPGFSQPALEKKLKSVATWTALCLVLHKKDNEKPYEAVQYIRKSHDKAYDRWMPHINIFFPFVDFEEFHDAEALVA